MKLNCLHCGHEWDGCISHDELGWHSLCPECGRTFDVDVPQGRIVMAFAWDETNEFFTDGWQDGNCIATYYAFETPMEFLKAWQKMVDEGPDGMWYWCLDDGKCFCSGACDPNDLDSFKARFSDVFAGLLTNQDIDDIMVGALEGGITYWCHKAEVVGEYLGEWASEQISRGGMLKLYDAEGGEKYWLDREKFVKGFKLWLENYDDRYDAVDIDGVDCCNIDGEMADMIIQYALFGEVLYG